MSATAGLSAVLRMFVEERLTADLSLMRIPYRQGKGRMARHPKFGDVQAERRGRAGEDARSASHSEGHDRTKRTIARRSGHRAPRLRDERQCGPHRDWEPWPRVRVADAHWQRDHPNCPMFHMQRADGTTRGRHDARSHDGRAARGHCAPECRDAEGRALTDNSRHHPAPLELLGASLGTCVALYVQQFCHTRGFPYEGLRVEVEPHGAAHPARIGEFVVRVLLPNEIPVHYAAMLERVARSCPAHNTLAHGAEVTVLITDAVSALVLGTSDDVIGNPPKWAG